MSNSLRPNIGRLTDDFTERVIAWVVVILLIVLVATLLLEPTIGSLARWQLFAVTLAVLGTLAATDGWVQHTMVRERLGGAITWILIGAFLAAISPVVSAYGWNGYSDAMRAREKTADIAAARLNLAKAVITDILSNISMIKEVVKDKHSEEEWEKLRFYPRLRTGSLQTAISGGLFVDDAKLLKPMVNVLDILAQMNTRFENYDQILARSTNQKRSELRKVIESPEHFDAQVLAPVIELGRLLIAEFDISEYAPYGLK
jgi:hypothetical protein